VQVYCEPGQNIPRGDTVAQELSPATASLVGYYATQRCKGGGKGKVRERTHKSACTFADSHTHNFCRHDHHKVHTNGQTGLGLAGGSWASRPEARPGPPITGPACDALRQDGQTRTQPDFTQS
jgi:hypothetical protein